MHIRVHVHTSRADTFTNGAQTAHIHVHVLVEGSRNIAAKAVKASCMLSVQYYTVLTNSTNLHIGPSQCPQCTLCSRAQGLSPEGKKVQQQTLSYATERLVTEYFTLYIVGVQCTFYYTCTCTCAVQVMRNLHTSVECKHFIYKLEIVKLHLSIHNGMHVLHAYRPYK